MLKSSAPEVKSKNTTFNKHRDCSQSHIYCQRSQRTMRWSKEREIYIHPGLNFQEREAEERTMHVTPIYHELWLFQKSSRSTHRISYKSIMNRFSKWLQFCQCCFSPNEEAVYLHLLCCLFERAIKGSSIAANKYPKRMGSRQWYKALSQQSECRCERHKPGG